MEESAGGPELDDIPVDGEPENQGENGLVAMQVWRAATMLGLNPDGGFNECDLNQWYRRMTLLLHLDVAARNGISLQEATVMFQHLGNARDLLRYHLQKIIHITCFLLICSAAATRKENDLENMVKNGKSKSATPSIIRKICFTMMIKMLFCLH